MRAIITATEKYQQPGLWKEAQQLYLDQLQKIEGYLNAIKEKHDIDHLLFTAAATSDFLGQSIANYINQVNE
ncbi:tagatose-6-phosphate ketose isomerase, partial [Streptococcus suis]